jgi:hypothetical protein
VTSVTVSDYTTAFRLAMPIRCGCSVLYFHSVFRTPSVGQRFGRSLLPNDYRHSAWHLVRVWSGTGPCCVGFWRLCMTFEIAGFMDCFHRMYWKVIHRVSETGWSMKRSAVCFSTYGGKGPWSLRVEVCWACLSVRLWFLKWDGQTKDNIFPPTLQLSRDVPADAYCLCDDYCVRGNHKRNTQYLTVFSQSRYDLTGLTWVSWNCINFELIWLKWRVLFFGP